ncbi:hypothetical protein Efla_004460 [Eimeria flavescens]
MSVCGARGALLLACLFACCGTAATAREASLLSRASGYVSASSALPTQEPLHSGASGCSDDSSPACQAALRAANEETQEDYFGVHESLEKASPSYLEVGYDPASKSSFRLYHEVFRGAVREVARSAQQFKCDAPIANPLGPDTLNYMQTFASLRSLMVCNPIMGSLFAHLREKRHFVKRLDKLVKREAPKNEKQRVAEFSSVLRLMARTVGASSRKLQEDASVMRAVRHLILSIREGKRNGLSSMFEALTTDAVFTVANSILYVGTRMVFRSFFRIFNLLFFPPLAAFTSGLAVAVGVTCLTGIPRLLAKVFKLIKVQVVKGITAAFKLTQLFRLRRDPNGVQLLKESFNSRFPQMLTHLWQLGSYDWSDADKSTVAAPSLTSEQLAYSFLTGVFGFSRQYAYLMEAEYLPGKEEESISCYVLFPHKLNISLCLSQCEATYRQTERFSSRSREVLSFINWMSLKDGIADLLLMIYNAAKLALEAQIYGDSQAPFETLRAAYRDAAVADSLTTNVAIKPKLSRDVHNITSGVAGLAAFFELRKLHRWKPQSAAASAASAKKQKKVDSALERKTLEGNDGEISLADQRFQAFADDADLPLDWEQAAPEQMVADESVLPAEKTLLDKFAAKRDALMMSMLRRSLSKLISAFSSIFGKLETLVKLATNQDRIRTCSLQDRRLCMNADEASKTRLTLLHILLSIHMGVALGPGGGVASSLEEMKSDFMSFISETASVRYRPPSINPLKRRSRWGLDLLLDFLFPDRKSAQNTQKPVTEEELTALEKAGPPQNLQCIPNNERFKMDRIQCIKEGALFLVTTDMGETKVFRPETPVTDDIKERLCTHEHQFVKFTALFSWTEAGGQLNIPGVAEIKGFLTDAAPILRAKQEEEDVGHLVEALLWSKGIQRIDARVASDMIVATKRLLYPEATWDEFFERLTPADLDFAQQAASAGVRLESGKYNLEKKTPRITADQIINGLAIALESTVILAGALRAGLHDLALITTGYLALEAINLAKRNKTGMTSLLVKFQENLWEEFAAKKQCASQKPVFLHAPEEKAEEQAANGTSQPAISSAFEKEEGGREPLFNDWCEELYTNTGSSPSGQHLADLKAEDSAAIQCSLLRFLGRRRVQTPAAGVKAAVFKYLQHVMEHLRKAKKTNKYSWKAYLNARPRKKGEAKEEAASVGAAIRRSFASLRKKAARKIKRVAHKIRSQAAKRLLGRRLFNILRGEDFLKILQLAALEAFADQDFFPSSVLIHPSTLAAYSRIYTVLHYEVQPIMDKSEAREIVMQMKMMPAASPAVKRLLLKLEAQLRQSKERLGDSFQKSLRQQVGFLSLLHTTRASAGLAGPQLAGDFSRFSAFLDSQSQQERTQFAVAERRLGFAEQASVRLLLKAADAVALLQQTAKEEIEYKPLPAEFQLLSLGQQAFFPSASGGAARLPQVGPPRILLFCSFQIPAVGSPNSEKKRKNALLQLKELGEILKTSTLPVFYEAAGEDVHLEAYLNSPTLESLEDFLASSEIQRDQTHGEKVAGAFRLHASFLKALEIIGLSKESDEEFECTHEDSTYGASLSLPVNTQSRLLMVASLLLHLADAEEVVAAFAPPPSVSRGQQIWAFPLAAQTQQQQQEPMPTERAGQMKPHEFLFDLTAAKPPKLEPPEEAESGDNFAEVSKGGTQPESFLQLQAEPPTSKEGEQAVKEEEKIGEKTASTAATSEDEQPAASQSSPVVKTHIVFPDLEAHSAYNARRTLQHLKQQVAHFDKHVVEFVSAFHVLLSAAKLPAQLHAAFLKRLKNELSVAIFGKPGKKRRAWTRRLARVFKRRGKNSQSKTANFLENESLLQTTNGEDAAFFNFFLIPSVERMNERIRSNWKKLMHSDFLSVQSTACQQSFASARVSPADAKKTLGVPTPKREEAEPREAAVCSELLWLELQARVTLEEEMLQDQQTFSYFFRMGIDSVLLLRKAIQEALMARLWHKMASAGWLSVASSQSQLPSIQKRLEGALLEIKKKHPFAAVEAIRDMLVAAVADFLQQEVRTREDLERRLLVLQQSATEYAAAYLLQMQQQQRQQEAGADAADAAASNSPEKAEQRETNAQDTSQTPQPNLHAFMQQAADTRDALLLLSRPGIFSPAAILIHAINTITSPKSRLKRQLKKIFKKTKQLTTASLDVLLRLPRAYIRLPSRHFIRRPTTFKLPFPKK